MICSPCSLQKMTVSESLLLLFTKEQTWVILSFSGANCSFALLLFRSQKGVICSKYQRENSQPFYSPLPPLPSPYHLWDHYWWLHSANLHTEPITAIWHQNYEPPPGSWAPLQNSSCTVYIFRTQFSSYREKSSCTYSGLNSPPIGRIPPVHIQDTILLL